MWILLFSVLKTALIQIMLSILTSAFMKEVILVALEKLVKHTDNDVDDKIVALVEAAVHGRLEDKNTSIDGSSKICPKCQAILD